MTNHKLPTEKENEWISEYLCISYNLAAGMSERHRVRMRKTLSYRLALLKHSTGELLSAIKKTIGL